MAFASLRRWIFRAADGWISAASVRSTLVHRSFFILHPQLPPRMKRPMHLAEVFPIDVGVYLSSVDVLMS